MEHNSLNLAQARSYSHKSITSPQHLSLIQPFPIRSRILPSPPCPFLTEVHTQIQHRPTHNHSQHHDSLIPMLYIHHLLNPSIYQQPHSMNTFLTGTEAEIQLPLKRFPDSSVSSLIPTDWCGRASHHQNLLQFPWVDNWLMANFPLVVELNLVKFRQRFGCLPWGKRPTLA